MTNERKTDWKQSDFRFNRQNRPFIKRDPSEKPYQPVQEIKKEEIDAPRKQEFEIIRRNEMDMTYAVLKFKKINPEAELPIRGTFGSAGYDICANLNEDVTIQPGETVKIPTGFATAFRKEFVALVYSRSGLATKNGLVVAQGTAVIDSDYRGEWFIPLYNQSNEPQLVRSGDRIAQLIVQPICRVKAIEVDDLNQTRRGEGGFGSTGA